MYGGVGSHTTLKGSGQSGYIQHSRAVAKTQLFDAAEGSHMIDKRTPLEKLRSQKDNEEMAARLEEHMKWRAIDVQVLEFEERLQSKNDVDEEAIAAQCDELRKTLSAQLEESLRKDRTKKQNASIVKGATGKKTANDFAIAFGVGKHKAAPV